VRWWLNFCSFAPIRAVGGPETESILNPHPTRTRTRSNSFRARRARRLAMDSSFELGVPESVCHQRERPAAADWSCGWRRGSRACKASLDGAAALPLQRRSLDAISKPWLPPLPAVG